MGNGGIIMRKTFYDYKNEITTAAQFNNSKLLNCGAYEVLAAIALHAIIDVSMDGSTLYSIDKDLCPDDKVRNGSKSIYFMATLNKAVYYIDSIIGSDIPDMELINKWIDNIIYKEESWLGFDVYQCKEVFISSHYGTKTNEKYWVTKDFFTKIKDAVVAYTREISKVYTVVSIKSPTAVLGLSEILQSLD